MKRIKLIFNNLGYNCYNQANVFIYDCNNNLILEGVTFNNEIELCLEENNVYKLIAISNYQKLITSFFVNKNNSYRFSFNVINENNTITFLLTDYYYNLPIERGELLLWQNQ